MLTLIFAVLAALLAGAVAYYVFGLSISWALVLGFTGMLAVQIIVTLLLRKLTNRVNQRIQEVMLETQKKLQIKQNHFMRHPSNQKLMMAQLEKEQAEGIRKALETCDLFDPLCRWNFFLKKQVNTMRMMFHYQLKDYDEVDKLLPYCMFIDNQSISIKMARMYTKEVPQEDIDKFFKKKCKRLRSEQAVLPFSLYTWILLKQNRADDAFKVITDAKNKTDDATIQKNWEFLANGKVKQFSNSGLGEVWYALGLEEMKMPKVQQPVYRHR